MSAPHPGRERWAALALVLAAVVLGAFARIDTALRDPNFDRESSTGLLKSDPALLAYLVERLVDGGGLPPDDFRADPRVLYPITVDLPARFTVGQEFLVAWARLLVGPRPPLHVLSVVVMGLWASLGAVGVSLLARGLGARPLVAGLVALLHALLPASYRTIGFVLVREDFSLPFWSLHLGTAALAVRGRSVALGLVSGLALGAALVTWHAMRFVVGLEALAVALAFLRFGANPLRARAGVVGSLAALALVVATPVGRASAIALSPPFAVLAGLAAAACLRGRGGRAAERAVGLLAALLVLLLARAGGAGWGADSHVRGLIAAKLAHLGVLPADPRALAFEVRLMWQGPFDTLDFASLGGELELALAAAGLLGLLAWGSAGLRRGSDPLLAAAVWLGLLVAPAAWLVARLLVLPALLWPALLALAPLGRWAERRTLVLGLLAGVQAFVLQSFLASHRIGWYLPPQRQAELASLIERIPRHVPAGEAVCADFVSSTALLVHLRTPIVLQPKYEDRESRERAREFFEGFFDAGPEEFVRLVRERFHARYLLVDRYTLWTLGRYLGGLPWAATAPRPGSAAELFLSQDEGRLRSLPSATLLDRSPPSLRWADGRPSDFYRLYRLEPEK